MYKVLHIMADADIGGISTVVLNYYRFIDRERFQFDLALTRNINGRDAEIFREYGANIYQLPIKSKGIKAYNKALEKLLAEHKYDVVHVHDNETSYVTLRVAKKMGIKNRIAHSHSSSPYFSIKSEIRRLSGCILNYCYATKTVACGKLAGERVFGKWNMKRKKAIVLPNAVDTELFTYSEETRNDIRRKMDVSDKYVIGMVGRMSPEKNYQYALNIAEQYHEIDPKCVLFIVGSGEQENIIKKIIADKHMEDYVILLGKRSDVPDLCQAFDILLLPSLYEGFPVVAVEAMATGLPVLLSSKITDELSFGSAVHYIDLKHDEIWLEKLVYMKNDTKRVERLSEVKEHNLDIRDTVKTLEKIYLSNVN